MTIFCLLMKKTSKILRIFIVIAVAYATVVTFSAGRIRSGILFQSRPGITETTMTNSMENIVQGTMGGSDIRQSQSINAVPSVVEAQTPEIDLFKDDETYPKIGQGVMEALYTEGQANVVIALEVPLYMKSPQVELPEVRREVARLQDQVLSSLDDSDYRLKLRYESVPALAGTVLSESGISKLAKHPDVIRVDLDVGGTGELASSVPLTGANEWHVRGITGAGIVIAVLDTGVDMGHVDFTGGILQQACFLDNNGFIDGRGLCPNGSDRQSGPSAAQDGSGHGTHVTGIVLSKGIISSAGMAPEAEILPIKVLDNAPFPGKFYFFSEIIAALDFIINQHPEVDIINMSLGTVASFSGNCDDSTAFNMAGAAAINTLRAHDVIAFAASGNGGSGTRMTSPACLSNVISVGATDKAGNVAPFTNSSHTTDLMAPGVGIVSTGLANGTFVLSGTSMASPHAAGCAALLIQSGVAVTHVEIVSRLKSSPILVTDPKNGLKFPRILCFP